MSILPRVTLSATRGTVMSLMVLVALSAVCTWGAKCASDLYRRETVRKYRLHKASMQRTYRTLYEKSLLSTTDPIHRETNRIMIRHHAELEQKYLDAANLPESPMTPDPPVPRTPFDDFTENAIEGAKAVLESSRALREEMRRKFPELHKRKARGQTIP